MRRLDVQFLLRESPLEGRRDGWYPRVSLRGAKRGLVCGDALAKVYPGDQDILVDAIRGLYPINDM